MKYTLNHSDADYRTAINYEHTIYYHFPITITVTYRRKSTKYILGCGASNQKSYHVRKNLLYVVTANSGLDYIGLTLIDAKEQTITETFHGNGELSYNPFDLPKGKQIFDYSTPYQIKILLPYILN